MKASCGISTFPICFIRFLPSLFVKKFFLTRNIPNHVTFSNNVLRKALIVSLAIILLPRAACIGISNCCLGITFKFLSNCSTSIVSIILMSYKWESIYRISNYKYIYFNKFWFFYNLSFYSKKHTLCLILIYHRSLQNYFSKR